MSAAVSTQPTYPNPLLAGFYPDPSVLRVGDDYYLANSSFEYFPGAPLFHSRDLLSWIQIGNILTRRNQFRLGDARPSTGIYGSTLRHHGGQFWFITTNVSDFAAGQVLVSATDPAGPWTDPVLVSGATGIDPDLAWDEADACYLTWKAMDFTTARPGYDSRPSISPTASYWSRRTRGGRAAASMPPKDPTSTE